MCHYTQQYYFTKAENKKTFKLSINFSFYVEENVLQLFVRPQVCVLGKVTLNVKIVRLHIFTEYVLSKIFFNN